MELMLVFIYKRFALIDALKHDTGELFQLSDYLPLVVFESSHSYAEWDSMED
jgi:hypothetical protein